MLTALESILSIASLITIGFILAQRRWFDEKSLNLIVKLVMQVSLPALMINTILTNFTSKQFLASINSLIIPMLSILLCYLVAILISKFLNIDLKKRGLFVSMFFNSNTIFMGMPINEAIFGDKSIPYVLLYYIANTIFFWTFGVYEISKDGTSNHENILSLKSLKNVISPPFMGFVTAMIILILNISLPKWVMDTCKYLGSLTTPLSMIFVGATIYSTKMRDFYINKEIIGVLIGRFFVSPIILILLTLGRDINELMRNVFVIQAAMPVMTNSAIISKKYNSDYKFASVMIAISTIASLFIVPLYSSILMMK